MFNKPLIANSIKELSSVELLRSLYKDIQKIDHVSMNTQGYSGSEFYKIHIEHTNKISTLVLKITDLSTDWFSIRTNDQLGREHQFISGNDFKIAHEILNTPYLATAAEQGRVGILMEDLSEFLFEDTRKPLTAQAEDLILEKLAFLHANYWNHPALKSHSWLHTPEDFLYIMGPQNLDTSNGHSARDVQIMIKEGWDYAFEILPETISEYLNKPPETLVKTFNHLPQTIIHGDSKVGNFAIKDNRQLSAFDWAFVGAAPCTFEIGWYISVNASRLSTSKEEVLLKYRSFLESNLKLKIGNEQWTEFERAGILSSAIMLLWSKARSLKMGREGAGEEWDWWENKLSQLIY